MRWLSTAHNNGPRHSPFGHRGVVSIRPARMKDLATVRSIVKDATRHMDEQGIPQWDEVYPSEAILKGDIQRQQMHLVEVERRTAGLVVINEDQSPEYSDVAWQYSGRVMVIHRLTIDPAFERRGLATRLMDFAEEAAACQGYACIRLDAFIQNPAAIALYENRGYRKAGIVRFRKGEFFCYEKEIRVEKPTKTSKGAADHAKKGFG